MSARGRAVCFGWCRGNSFWLYQEHDCLFQAGFFPQRVHCLRKPSFPLFHWSGFPKNTVNHPLSLCCITINPQPEDKHLVKTPPDPEFSHCWDTPINVVIQWWRLLRTPFPWDPVTACPQLLTVTLGFPQSPPNLVKKHSEMFSVLIFRDWGHW